MQANILKTIILEKEKWLVEHSSTFPLDSFKDDVIVSQRSFYAALERNHYQAKYILECKKASPSKGLIRSDFCLKSILSVYQNYASVVSVLTDEAFFQGSFDYVSEASELVDLPILNKDFFISPYQVYLARYKKADAILLMLSVLSVDDYILLRDLAHSLGMGVLTEVSNETELFLALDLNARIIGINNRDLRDLSVDINRTAYLVSLIPDSLDCIVVSESGFAHYSTIQKTLPHANCFLIGSSLMAEVDLNLACRRLMFGFYKVCGLTTLESVRACERYGVSHAGLIFVESSPRFVSKFQALELVKDSILSFVGVFQNAAIETVLDLCQSLNFSVIQLHGQEDLAYILNLESALKRLNINVKIWKAFAISDGLIDFSLYPDCVEYFILDSRSGDQFGGTGKIFDWSLLKEVDLSRCILSGGLSLDNIDSALALGCAGYDFNSGVESQKGVKDLEKIKNLFSYLHGANYE